MVAYSGTITAGPSNVGADVTLSQSCDQTAGAVMEARSVDMKMGTDSLIFYGMEVPDADVILSDGISLEHKGVTPDTPMVKTAPDMAAERDPVLSAALKTLGVEISADDAGKVFPFDWKVDTQ